MSAIDNIPVNKNFLSPLGFVFQIKKSPNVNFFIQNVNLPGLSLTQVETPNPFVKVPYSGDHINYDDLMISFKVDGNLNNYREIHDWIRQLGFPEDFKEYKQIASQPIYSGLGIKSDISLIILSSSRNPIYEVIFKDAFPVSLSSLIFDSTADDVMYLQAESTFRYSTYTISTLTS